MSFLRQVITWARQTRPTNHSVHHEDLLSVSPGQAWPPLAPPLERRRHVTNARRQVRSFSALSFGQSGRQPFRSAEQTGHDDHATPRALRAIQGLWALPENIKFHVDLTARMFLIDGGYLVTCGGVRHGIALNGGAAQFVVAGSIFEVDAQHQTLKCTFSTGRIRYYRQLILPSKQAVRFIQGSWQTMRNKQSKRKQQNCLWRQLIISGYRWHGKGTSDGGGFLQVGATGAIEAGTNTLFRSKDGLLVVTMSCGRKVPYFRMRGDANLGPIEESPVGH